MVKSKLHLNLKKGMLHKMLGLPQGTTFPQEIVNLLEVIKETPIGTIVANKTGIGKPEIKVTRLLKERAVLALSMRTWHRAEEPKKVSKPRKSTSASKPKTTKK